MIQHRREPIAEMARRCNLHRACDFGVDGHFHQGAQALPIRKLASGELVAGGEEGQFIAFVPGADGTVRYLHFNMRAFRRM